MRLALPFSAVAVLVALAVPLLGMPPGRVPSEAVGETLDALAHLHRVGGGDGWIAIPVEGGTLTVNLRRHASQKHGGDAWECRESLSRNGPREIRRSNEYPDRLLLFGNTRRGPCMMVVSPNKDGTWREHTSFVPNGWESFVAWIVTVSTITSPVVVSVPGW